MSENTVLVEWWEKTVSIDFGITEDAVLNKNTVKSNFSIDN